jgi:Trypsin-like peptidase domain
MAADSFEETTQELKTMTWLRAMSLGFLMAAALSGSGIGRAFANEVDFKKRLPSVAWVISPDDKDVSTGSGVLIDARRGLVLTAAHVVEARPDAVVFFAAKDANGKARSQSRWYLERIETFGSKGHVIAADTKHDLAVIQLERVPETAQEIVIAKESPDPGASLYSIGNSGAGEGALWRYFSGEVRQVYPTVFHFANNVEVDAQVIETTLPSNPGDSGGPILNANGELVGITSAGNVKERAVSLGIDVAEIRAMLDKNHLTVEAAALPVARILSQTIERDVFQYDRKGVMAHVSFEIKGAKGLACEVMAIVYDAKGRPIVSKDPEVSVVGGTLGTELGIKPSRDEMTYRNMVLFIPYEAIRKSVPMTPGEMFEPEATSPELWCSVQIRDVEGKRWIVEKAVTTTFRFDRSTNDNGPRLSKIDR